MKQIALLGSTLIATSALCLSGCDNPFQREKNEAKSSTQEASTNQTLRQHKQAKELTKALDPVENTVTQEHKQSKEPDSVGTAETIVTEENKQEEYRALDFSLNLEIKEFNGLPYARGISNKQQLPGVFGSERVFSNIQMEAHFEGPYNENKEQEMTPDGAGVKFKMDF
ncbi:MAG: hypothetical protein DRQ62_06490 [Gammaproteobacteria bacterium]|nr:MAG: hypothetical protein DRQ62_06490 [Gammaproteobacteria bacterium]